MAVCVLSSFTFSNINSVYGFLKLISIDVLSFDLKGYAGNRHLGFIIFSLCHFPFKLQSDYKCPFTQKRKQNENEECT